MQKKLLNDLKNIYSWQEPMDIVDFADADEELNGFEQAAENAYDEKTLANDDWFE